MVRRMEVDRRLGDEAGVVSRRNRKGRGALVLRQVRTAINGARIKVTLSALAVAQSTQGETPYFCTASSKQKARGCS